MRNGPHFREKSGAFYRPELDVLRFAAFLLVFLHHLFPRVASGYEPWASPPVGEVLSSFANAFGFGLSLFFFLSAYLITSLLRLEIQTTGKLHPGYFFIRRILRIWPLYLFGLAILAVISLLHHLGLTQFFYYLAMCGNWYFIVHGRSENPMSLLWSISVEEQFYLVLPFALMFLRGKPQILGAILGVFLASMACLYWQGATHKNIDVFIWFNTGSQAIFFAAGMALAIFTLNRQEILSIGLRVALQIISFASLFAAAYCFEAKRVANASDGFSVCAGYGCAALGCAGLVYSLLDCGWKFPWIFVYLGRISYGLYVFHVLSMYLVDNLYLRLESLPFALHVSGLFLKIASLPITVGLAMLSYHYLELPFLRLKPRFTYIPNRVD